jgi:hypothetical protein
VFAIGLGWAALTALVDRFDNFWSALWGDGDDFIGQTVLSSVWNAATGDSVTAKYVVVLNHSKVGTMDVTAVLHNY